MVISAWDLVEIRIISAWDLVFSFWDKDLFLHGILCLVFGIKIYFCMVSCFMYWDKELFLPGTLF